MQKILLWKIYIKMRKKNFKISLGIYPQTIYFSLGETDKEFKVFTKKEKIKNLPKCVSNLNDLGIFCSHAGTFYHIIRIKNYPDNPVDFGTLMHEILHSIVCTCRDIGIELSRKSEETYTYLMGYITEEVMKQIQYGSSKEE
jgi:hypothetical protein